MRVQVPAYTDRWMMGDRYGEVVGMSKARASVRAKLLTRDPRRYDGEIEIVRVKLDKSGKICRFVLADCTEVSQ